MPEGTNTEEVIAAISEILKNHADTADEPNPQVGIHDFTYGGYVIGLRSWVPGRKYFQVRYDVNRDIRRALHNMGVELLTPTVSAIALQNPSSVGSVQAEKAPSTN